METRGSLDTSISDSTDEGSLIVLKKRGLLPFGSDMIQAKSFSITMLGQYDTIPWYTVLYHGIRPCPCHLSIETCPVLSQKREGIPMNLMLFQLHRSQETVLRFCLP